MTSLTWKTYILVLVFCQSAQETFFNAKKLTKMVKRDFFALQAANPNHLNPITWLSAGRQEQAVVRRASVSEPLK
jgi:hypothetical protein